jgi:N-acyl-phosphatidylethanolamine-hydrolysing phospholipase D
MTFLPGTWVLTTEPIMEPPQKLREACATAGIAEGIFDICGLGETRVF